LNSRAVADHRGKLKSRLAAKMPPW